jgi:alpha-beta hydrolase superfamily lysophospholipase
MNKGKKKEWNRTPVVIYMHGNASSRLEAGPLVAKLLERNISLFCFDWAGCGLSDGEYISLGWHERDDLASVIEHLRKSMFNGPIALWGRSMGAVTALMHVHRDPTLAAMCVDSPFMSLRVLIEEIAQSDRLLLPVPSWLVNAIYNVIRHRVQALADFDINNIVTLEHGPRSSVPTIFMHGQDDTFIAPHHTEELYNNYAGTKELVLFDGDHNSERSEKILNRSVDFLYRTFHKYEIELSVAQHLADVHFSVPVQDGLPHRIPHLPRPSVQRKVLGDITNFAQRQQENPGFRAALAEAQRPKSPNEKRPPPRKFAGSSLSRAVTPPRQPSEQAISPASDDSTENMAKAKSAPDRLLANRVYPTIPRSSSGSDSWTGENKGLRGQYRNSWALQAAHGGA